MSVASRRTTIIDVAERAGVSRQTVSRAMNGMPGISTATRTTVLEAAKELNYRPSRFGRGLVEQGPTTLGLVVSDLSNSYFAELGAAVLDIHAASLLLTGGRRLADARRLGLRASADPSAEHFLDTLLAGPRPSVLDSF